MLHENPLSALSWQLAMGADEAMAETPQDRRIVSPPVQKRVELFEKPETEAAPARNPSSSGIQPTAIGVPFGHTTAGVDAPPCGPVASPITSRAVRITAGICSENFCHITSEDEFYYEADVSQGTRGKAMSGWMPELRLFFPRGEAGCPDEPKPLRATGI